MTDLFCLRNFQSADENFQPRFDGAVNDLYSFILNAGKEMERNDSVQHPPDGIPVLTEIERRGKLAPFDTVFENLFDDANGLVGGFNDVVIEILRQIHVGGMEHKCHQYSEQFPIVQEEVHVDVRKPHQRLRRAGWILQKIGNTVVKLVDVAQKNLRVNLFLAVVIEVNRPLAQFGLPGNTLDGDRFEALLEKKLPRRLKDGVLPIFTFPLSSLFQSQWMNPSKSLNCQTPYERAGDPHRI
jgi:hypothetical protein